MWKVSLALKRNHSGTNSWGWQVLMYMWAGPLSSFQTCSPLNFASKCGPCCCLNAIFGELSGRCSSPPGTRSGPWLPISSAVCLHFNLPLICFRFLSHLICLSVLYPIWKVVCFPVIDSNWGSAVILLSETLSSRCQWTMHGYRGKGWALPFSSSLCNAKSYRFWAGHISCYKKCRCHLTDISLELLQDALTTDDTCFIPVPVHVKWVYIYSLRQFDSLSTSAS